MGYGTCLVVFPSLPFLHPSRLRTPLFSGPVALRWAKCGTTMTPWASRPARRVRGCHVCVCVGAFVCVCVWLPSVCVDAVCVWLRGACYLTCSGCGITFSCAWSPLDLIGCWVHPCHCGVVAWRTNGRLELGTSVVSAVGGVFVWFCECICVLWHCLSHPTLPNTPGMR